MWLVVYWDCDRAFSDLGLSPEGDAESVKKPKGAEDIYGENWTDFT